MQLVCQTTKIFRSNKPLDRSPLAVGELEVKLTTKVIFSPPQLVLRNHERSSQYVFRADHT